MPIVLITGGTGLVGTNLTRHLTEKGYQVIILSRTKRISKNPNISYSTWDVEKKIIDGEVIKKADHIIHLAGAGIMDKKWTNEYKKIIVESRTKSAQLLINAIKENENHIKTFVSASAIGWYGEDAKPLIKKEGFVEADLAAKDFVGETCLLWEASTEASTDLGIRLVKLRTGIVLSNNGGEFKEFITPLKFGLAPILGNGKQIISWIHIDDLSRIYIEAIENNFLNGSYNSVAPLPLAQKDFILTLANQLKNKFFTPIYVPAFFLKFLYGKRSSEILKSTTVSNKKIRSAGLTFLYPTIEAAINDLIKRKEI